jgi:dienelactone hydrolase
MKAAARILLLLIALFAGRAAAGAEPLFIQQPLQVLLGGDLGTLEGLFIRPRASGRYPLVLLAHGSPRSGADRANMTPLAMLPQALEFARRGWAVAIVMRRGYGGSDGGWAESFGSCDSPDYTDAGYAGAADLKRTLEFLAHRADIDPARMIAVGVSAGGFATVALTADPPPGLLAAISFAGGRGSQEADHVCHAERLIEAFRAFGKRSRIPMLWVYAANDHFFSPALAQQLKAAFTQGGGSVDFVAAPAFGEDGHGLFSPAGIPIWTGYADAFLKLQNLTLRETPIALPPPAVTAPKMLGGDGQKAFASFLIDAPHKAFAAAPDGSYGYQTGQRTIEAARSAALKYCAQHAKACSVLFVDDAAVAP